jgi:fatty-acyl-CoA synthase
VQVFFVDAIPLTAVGKVFKPALRWDATQRVVSRMLAELQPTGATIAVDVGAHASHGSLIRVGISGVAEPARVALSEQVHARLSPLVIRYEIAWT